MSTDGVRVAVGPVPEWPASALADLLAVAPPDVAGGDPLPLGWHWLYLLDHAPQADLGPDGHPMRGVYPSPPAPNMRRMWAGGSLTTLAPLLVGEEVTRRSRVVDSTTKQGRTGALVFLRVESEFFQRGERALVERQDIVYREASGAPAPPPVIGEDADLEPGDWAIPITPTLLFRFSALTYNAHRIHYDRDYARTREGYPGLVTHGPLQVLAMAESLRAHPDVEVSRPARFDYRLISPLFEHQGLVVRADPDPETDRAMRAVARDRSGRHTAEGTYTLL